MKNEPTVPHFARPVHFGGDEDCDCAFCGDPITLYSNPDGRRIWVHRADDRTAQFEPDGNRDRPEHNGANVTDGGPL